MKHLKYCPKCGQETLIFDGEKKFSCSQCDFVMYQNIAAAVAVLIRCEDELLLTKRNQNPKIGKLDLAGGFTDPKESAEETCARELKEELGIDTEISEKFSFIYKADVGGNLWEHELDHVFVGNYEGDFQLNLEEVAEVRYISMENLDQEMKQNPEHFTEWFKIILEEYKHHL